MITIVEPLKQISALWSKPVIRDEMSFRLMQYVLVIENNGKTILHNVVTGHLVVLDQKEAKLLEKTPIHYSNDIEALVSNHFLVEEDYDEHNRVLKMRQVLRVLALAQGAETNKVITNYTILPTTACNARCYYCFEKGIRSHTMTEQIAEKTVNFISKHCGEKKRISIRWFGGEPTVASHRIDQICIGLKEKGIEFSSSMTTNGYLFDQEMVLRAKKLWKLKSVMICVDGIEEHYNSIKSYCNVKDNPYQRVLTNIGMLLEQRVHVSLRMNFDVGNFTDFEDLLKEVVDRFHDNSYLQVYAFPVIGEYEDKTGKIQNGSEDWFYKKIVEMNDKAREKGKFRRDLPLPSLFYGYCKASDPSCIVISANGDLGRCTSIFQREDQIVGNVENDIIVNDYQDRWGRLADPEGCKECELFPNCILIENCPGKNRCFKSELFRQYKIVINNKYQKWIKLKGRTLL